jgi:DNA polymerase III delta subunit
MEAWIVARGKELGVTFGPGAARLLTERVGGYVREADVDRRRQTGIADQELRKLALYRPDGTVTRQDVAELVTEAVPGSTWALLDAVGTRRAADATMLAERLLADAVPVPLLVAQLHRRLRELVIVRDHLESGTRGPALMRAMRLQPYRAQKLQEQAVRWTPEALREAINGLVDLDLTSKGIALDGSTRQMSAARTALALQLWLAEAIGPTTAGRSTSAAAGADRPAIRSLGA